MDSTLIPDLEKKIDRVGENFVEMVFKNALMRGLLREALEGMEHVPADPGSWLARVREAVK